MEFDCKFKCYVGEPGRADLAQASQHGPPADIPTERTTRVVDQFDHEPVQAPHLVALKRDQQAASSKIQRWLFKKSSYQNIRGDQSRLTITELKQKKNWY